MNQSLIIDNVPLDGEDLVISYDSDGNSYSYYSDDKWVIWSSGFDVSFSRLSGRFKDSTKKVIYNIINSHTLKSKKSTIENILSGAAVFEACITACGGDDFNYINSDPNYRLFLLKAKERKLKYKTWKNHFIFSSHAKEIGLISRDIGNAEKLSIELSVNGELASQAICLPERIAEKYYSEALKVVESYYPFRHEISSAYNDFISEYTRLSGRYLSNISTRKNAIRKIKSIPDKIDISFDYGGFWLSRLRGACYTVIAAFTGCRDGEIKSFNVESYQEKKYAGMIIPMLHGVDTKPNVGGVKRHRSWVTIPSVKKAIELLWDSFSFAREEWRRKASSIEHMDEKERFLINVDSLFVTLPHMRGHRPNAGKQSISHSLTTFVKSIGYRATNGDVHEFDLLNPTRKGELKVGEILKVHPHAFRRTFSVYLVRNKLASLLDIKYQFKHMNIAMTSWYANQANIASYVDMMIDTDLQNEIAGENQIYITDTFYYIYNEAETLAGPEGRRIRNLRVEGDTSIYLSREEISKQVEEGRLSIVEHPGGYCTNPDCDRICDMTTCQYKVVTKDKAMSLVTIRERLIVKYNELLASGLDMPNVRSKIFYEIRSIEKVLSEHYIEYAAFDKKEFDI